MTQMPESARTLLRDSIEGLADAASWFVRSRSGYANRAREKLRLHGLADRGHECFHGTILCRFLELKGLLDEEGDGDLDADVDKELGRTLDVLEALVDDAPEEADGDANLLPYPGLRYMLRQYEDDKARKSGIRRVAHRRYLRYLPRVNRDDLKDQLERCCKTLSAREDKKPQNHDSLLQDIETIQEWRLRPGNATHANNLKKVLSHHGLGTGQARVAFGRYAKSQSALGFSDSYMLCFSQHGKWHRTHVTLEQQEQGPHATTEQSNFGFIKKKRVQFTGKPLDSTSRLSHALKHGPMPRKICLGQHHVRVLDADPWPPQEPLKPLGDAHLLDEIDIKDRTVLAVALVYTYLHLADTCWWPKDDTKEHIWLESQRDDDRPRLKQPFYLEHCALQSSKGAKGIENFLNRYRPSLPALGFLLLRIWKGAEIVGNPNEALKECGQAFFGNYWLFAIETCLGADSTLQQPGSLCDEGPMRKVFVLKVIKSLQWLLEKGFRLSIEDVFSSSDADKRSAVPHDDSDSSRSSGAPIKCEIKLEKQAIHFSLHDDEQRWQMKDAACAAAAEQYLSTYIQRVHAFVPVPHAGDPVKVAVIDTGLSLDKRSSSMHKRRIRELRNWVDAKDVENGDHCAPDNDSDGHGTHTATTLLKIDPECKLYVAKVFKGRSSTSGPDQELQVQTRVANAIRYAIHVWKVDVISMSFGFDEHVEVVDQAIHAAETQGVLLFAAASNNGGSDTGAWPARRTAVFSIYATDGWGNKYFRNPTPTAGDECFATLGVEVKQPGGHRYLSGTSMATPIAAGTASTVIRFMRETKPEYAAQCAGRPEKIEAYDACLKRLSTFAGMRQVFRMMAPTQRDSYRCLWPWEVLSDEAGAPVAIADRIVRDIRRNA